MVQDFRGLLRRETCSISPPIRAGRGARIETASNAAFVAPAFPIASVPTGTPAGICTIESSESMPLSVAALHRHA